ncbi:beta-ketoacyl synthase N-terminal-like domain-containing protein [Acinetobacter beijerinckii]|uniref:beta-ketoacyl synthase N-terminal-like domain-containing protein n=1 Tax=Acinetobacter TaxID=469 RepID=UPI00145F8AB4|nr:beta-ketoacyl synthase N-terminal-like domain-containing protein [Acinetobacter sp. Z1]MBC9230819.1 beta-ketoacyl-ACP synthase I [Acinetobacter baumannii]UTO18754.1 beta-ketoacyl-ACP synthase I [Acinetobacter sp. Z1]
MKRVVITGMGINSCIGNSLEEVTHSLKNGISGTRFNPTYAELNFKSHVSAAAVQEFDNIDRKLKRFMGVCAMYAYNTAIAAVEHAGLKQEDLANNPRYGIAGGSGGNSTASVTEMVKLLEEKGARKIGPFFVPRNMSNTITANVGVALKLQGVAHSITSACATSADAIGYAYNLIQLGKQDLMLAGGGEEDHWSQSLLFDAMGALCSKYNDSPETASRPYSADRDGFVIAGGGGFVVLESLEHAQARGANILAEVVAYAANSDGADMVAPSGEGATRCILMALDEAKQHGVETVDYVNTHGTSTPAGDITELKAMERAFGEGQVPAFSSTKSMTGHSLGAAGVQEAIYSVLMMQNDFIAPNINVTELDEGAKGFDLVLEKRDAKLNTVMSNSFGFGGVNACLIFKKWDA